MVATTGPEEASAEDRMVGAGERVFYRVTALDRDGLESVASDWIEVESVGYGLRGDAYDAAVHLHWDPVVQEQFAEMQILLEGWFRPSQIDRVTSEGFVHREVKSGKRYRYRVVGVRDDGSFGPPSRIVDVVVPH